MSWMKEECPIPIYNSSKNKLWEEENLVNVINKLKPEKLNRKEYIQRFKK